MAEFSIIIPNRGNLELLQRAINSIPNTERIEIIVVDDASSLSSDQKANYPGINKPNCVVVFTEEGKGAGFARNIGLKYASGRWLVFMDSDDFFLDGAQELLEKHCNDSAEVVFFRCLSVYSDSMEPSPRLMRRDALISRYSNRPRLLDYYNRYFHTEPWGKMIRRDLVLRKHIFFEETSCANDYLFSVKTGYFARSIKYEPEPLYCVTMREESLSWQLFDSTQKIKDRLLVYWHVQSFFTKKGILLFPFYEFWENCMGASSDVSSLAEEFRIDNRIPRPIIRFGCLLFAIKKKLRLGVPYV